MGVQGLKLLAKLGHIIKNVSVFLRQLSGSYIQEGLKLFFKTFWCVLYSRGSYIRERLIIERIRYVNLGVLTMACCIFEMS